MTKNNELYYQPEDKAPVQGILICLVFAIAAGVIGGLVYALAAYYIPFIYISVLLAAGYGFLLGKTMDFGFKIGKIRGFKFQKILAVIGGLIGLYCTWAIWLGVVTETGFFSMILKPLEVWQMVSLINVLGLWSLSDGDPITGTFLWICWLIEAIVIVGVAIYVASEDRPFSVAGDNWAEEHVLLARQPLANPAAYVADLERKEYKELLAMPRGNSTTHHTLLTMYDCKGCDDYFLHTQSILMEVDDDGKVEPVAYDVTKYIKVDPQAARELMALR